MGIWRREGATMPTGASRCRAYRYYREGGIGRLDRSIKKWCLENLETLKGLNQSELANYMGIGPSSLSEWKNEEKAIPMDNVGLIDIAFRSRYDDLSESLVASLRLETNLPSHREAA